MAILPSHNKPAVSPAGANPLDPNAPLPQGNQQIPDLPVETQPEPEVKPEKAEEPRQAPAEEGVEDAVLKRTQTRSTEKSAELKAREREKTSLYENKDQPQILHKQTSSFGKVSVQETIKTALQKSPSDGSGALRSLVSEDSASQDRWESKRTPLFEPQAGAYRTLLKDPIFHGPLKGAAIYQKLLAEMNRQLTLQHSQGQESFKEIFKKGDIGLLFNLRHKLKQDEAKKSLRDIVKFFIKSRQQTRQKIQALRYQSESSHRQETRKTQQAKNVSGDPAKDLLTQKLKTSAADSLFEETLIKTLEDGSSVPELAASLRARFAAKSEAQWRDFFKRVLNLSSAEAEDSVTFSRLVEALFRGLYQAEGSGPKMLVSDLTLVANGEVDEAKFSRLALADEGLVQVLKNLQPGDVIGLDVLQRLGERLDFLRLVHLPEGVVVLTEQQKQAILHEMRQQRSAESQKNLEKALVAQRQSRDPDDNSLLSGKTPVVFVGDVFNKKERYSGRPEIVMYLTYSVGALAALILLFLLWRMV